MSSWKYSYNSTMLYEMPENTNVQKHPVPSRISDCQCWTGLWVRRNSRVLRCGWFLSPRPHLTMSGDSWLLQKEGGSYWCRGVWGQGYSGQYIGQLPPQGTTWPQMSTVLRLENSSTPNFPTVLDGVATTMAFIGPTVSCWLHFRAPGTVFISLLTWLVCSCPSAHLSSNLLLEIY